MDNLLAAILFACGLPLGTVVLVVVLRLARVRV